VFPAKAELARELLALAPAGFSKVFFTLGGAEANENALKIARMVTGRYKMVSRYRSYHGASMGALSLTGDFRRPPVEPGLPGVIHVLDGPEAIEQVLELEGPRSVAAVILESVPGANGVVIPAPDYWPRVRAACDRHDTLLIADEVLTGFGRTGRCFGFEHFGAVPDIITVAKALTAGYAALGAVLASERVARHFDDNVLWAGLTSYAHPLGCAAGREALAIYRDEKLFERARTLEPVLRSSLERVRARFGGQVVDVRGIGLLAALEMDLPEPAWQRLNQEVARRHLYLHIEARRKTAIFSPPLIISEQDLRGGIDAFSDAVADCLC
jgi:taurine--2-oxoglutarate transaminase